MALKQCSCPYLQWMKSGTGLYWLKEAASRLMQISTLSPAMIRTAALFSSSKICHCKEAHRSSMKSSGKTEVRSLNLGLQMQVTVPIQHELLLNSQGGCAPKLDSNVGAKSHLPYHGGCKRNHRHSRGMKRESPRIVSARCWVKVSGANYWPSRLSLFVLISHQCFEAAIWAFSPS